jgi:hypothetical protein
MEKKSQIRINILVPITLLICSTVIPLMNGSMNFLGFILFSAVFISSFCVGLIFLDFLKTKYSLKGDILYNLSLYIGLIFLSPLLLLQKQIDCNLILIISVLLSFVIGYKYLHTRQVNIIFEFKYQLPIILSSLITLVLFANFREIISAVPIMYKSYFQDFYWFTAMTSSIKDFDFTNSNFEDGVGIYHHVLGLFPASYISALTNLSSHTSLWSITMPIALFTAFSSLVFIIQQFFNKVRSSHLFFALILFTFHFPLNPKCFINGNIEDAVWFGTGHTLPILPTWAAVYTLSVLLIIVILKSKELNYINILIVSLLTFLLAWAKITAIIVFYPFLFIFLFYIEKRLFSNRQKLLFLSLIPIFFLFQFYYSNSSAKFIFEPGQIIVDNLNSTNITPFNLLMAILISIISIGIWIGIKWLLLIKSTPLVKKISLSFLITLSFCVFLQTILKIKSFDSIGMVIDDSSYDIQQFMRSAFIYIDIFALLIFYRFLNNTQRNRTLIYTTVVLPIAISLFSIFLLSRNIELYFPYYYTSTSKWNYQVINDLNRYKHSKKAMISDFEYSGQFISAHDIDNFYLCIENRNGGYTYNYSNTKKYQELNYFLKGKFCLEDTKYLKNEKIKILIATPKNINDFYGLTNRGLIKKVCKTNWLFCIVD